MPQFQPFDLGAAYATGENILRSRDLRQTAIDRTQIERDQLEAEQKKAAEEQEIRVLVSRAEVGDPQAGLAIAGKLGERDPNFAAWAQIDPENASKAAILWARQGLGLKDDKPEKPDRRVIEGRLVEVSDDGNVTELYAAPEKPLTPREGPTGTWGSPFKKMVDGKPMLVSQHSITGEERIVGEPPPEGVSTKDVQGLRKEFRSLPTVKAFEETLPLLVSARNAPDNGYGDLQLIYTAGKLLDPGSVVREGEVALAIAAGSPIQRVLGITQFNAEAGGRLTPKARQQLLGMLNERVLSYRQAYERDRTEYRRYAAEQGVNPNDVIGTHPADAYSKGAKPKPAPSGKFEVGKLYEDAQGNKAIYLGRDKSGKDMWQEPR